MIRHVVIHTVLVVLILFHASVGDECIECHDKVADSVAEEQVEALGLLQTHMQVTRRGTRPTSNNSAHLQAKAEHSMARSPAKSAGKQAASEKLAQGFRAEKQIPHDQGELQPGVDGRLQITLPPGVQTTKPDQVPNGLPRDQGELPPGAATIKPEELPPGVQTIKPDQVPNAIAEAAKQAVETTTTSSTSTTSTTTSTTTTVTTTVITTTPAPATTVPATTVPATTSSPNPDDLPEEEKQRRHKEFRKAHRAGGTAAAYPEGSKVIDGWLVPNVQAAKKDKAEEDNEDEHDDEDDDKTKDKDDDKRKADEKRLDKDDAKEKDKDDDQKKIDRKKSDKDTTEEEDQDDSKKQRQHKEFEKAHPAGGTAPPTVPEGYKVKDGWLIPKDKVDGKKSDKNDDKKKADEEKPDTNDGKKEVDRKKPDRDDDKGKQAEHAKLLVSANTGKEVGLITSAMTLTSSLEIHANNPWAKFW
eukprot:gnl/TRDRNA2_/TRDRNA2_161238_c0_seq4.p1 gnl/TRDRNA2_/TRDRNA2_161238_c0~~gnl/TRDRNA2_/TRDRNA2_161238_c0_seq4.p1  ORF type:complete len:472 (-),score=148.46 gnl/TRDRNA2_/TRDRNA2_161238_c0_seq4:109-1524(-)